MKSLILDTSSLHITLALSEEAQLLDSHLVPHENSLSSLLPLSIQKFLKKHHLSPKELSSIYVGIGPGSYTGIRSSIALAKGISLAAEIPLYPFCSLLAYLPSQKGPILILKEAKNGRPYILELIPKENLQILGLKTFVTAESVLSEKFSNHTLFAIDPIELKKEHPILTNLTIFPAHINLNSLCDFLHSPQQKETKVSHTHLHLIEPIYFNSISLPPSPIESLKEPATEK
ncbi:MAG: tRNA (adenosine(37)-N6)-threonylcarbamoyltransferase complex dimerization subunit type 1 TsaB [Chlamydiae bacterium]|nr:tRNA (adenosine(37)-N6)-threonylcarbamoyltransferase complex dimerization subunit type 1 TsaB [Chlamydiota bacterium]